MLSSFKTNNNHISSPVKPARVNLQLPILSEMCLERLRCYNFCRASPTHGYWQLDICFDSIRNGGVPCDVRIKETQITLPAPTGAEFCPYVGCSQDPRYQRQDPSMTVKGRKGWGNQHYSQRK